MAQYDTILSQNTAGAGITYTERIVNISKGDILSATAGQVPTILAAGSDTYVLIRDDAEATGLNWAEITSLLTAVTVAQGGTGIATVAADCLLTGNGTDPLTVESTLKFSAGLLKIIDSTDSEKELRLDANSVDNNAVSIYHWDTDGEDFQDLILGGTAKNSGIYIKSDIGKIGIFNDAPAYELDLTGTLLVSQNLHLTNLAATTSALLVIDAAGLVAIKELPNVSSTEVLTVDASYNISSTTINNILEVNLVNDDRIINNSSTIVLAHTYTITNAAYEALAPNGTIKYTVAFKRDDSGGIGSHGTIDFWLRLGTENIVHMAAENSDQYTTHILEIEVMPLNGTLSLGTIKIFSYGEGQDPVVVNKVGYTGIVDNGFATHGAGNDLNLYVKDSETDSEVWMQMIRIEKIE